MWKEAVVGRIHTGSLEGATAATGNAVLLIATARAPFRSTDRRIVEVIIVAF